MDKIENLTFREFSARNRKRCEAVDGFNHRIEDRTLSDWCTALIGEVGEAANIAKKLNRYRDGIRGNTESAPALRAMLADEIADIFVYLDLLAQSQGFDLNEIVQRKFNATSQKIGYVEKLVP